VPAVLAYKMANTLDSVIGLLLKVCLINMAVTLVFIGGFILWLV